MKTGPIVAPSLAVVTMLASITVAYLTAGRPWATVSSKALLHAGAINGQLLRDGEVWRLFTAQLVHQKQLHMLSNVLAGLVAGSALERSVGRLRFAAVYWVGGTLGILASVWFSPKEVSSGASQALMAVCAGVIFLRLAGGVAVGRGILATAWAAILVSLGLDCYAVGFPKLGHVVGFAVGAVVVVMLGRGERSGGGG